MGYALNFMKLAFDSSYLLSAGIGAGVGGLGGALYDRDNPWRGGTVGALGGAALGAGGEYGYNHAVSPWLQEYSNRSAINQTNTDAFNNGLVGHDAAEHEVIEQAGRDIHNETAASMHARRVAEQAGPPMSGAAGAALGAGAGLAAGAGAMYATRDRR